MPHTTPMPGETAPSLVTEVLGGDPIDLSADTPAHFSLVFFYRGAHCPICRTQLEELARRRDEFEKAGITVHAVSMDGRERAERQKAEWAIDALPIGYGLSEASAREWGLFISGKEQDAEPERFAEPAIAAVTPDGRLYALWLQNTPIARPSLGDLLDGLNFLIKKNYPVRGKLAA